MGSAEILLISSLLLMGTAIYLFVSAMLGEDNDQTALSWASEDKPQVSKSKFIEFSRPLAHRFSMNLAKKITHVKYRNKTAYRIKVAGLSRILNVDEFIAMQILWGVMFPIFMFLMNFSLQMHMSPLMIIGLSIIGAAFPIIHCNAEKKARYSSVIIDLPFFIDLMALATGAGLDFSAAMQRIVDKAQDSVLANEFETVLQDIKFGASRKVALKEMVERLDISEITSFVAVLVDAEATGTSIGKVLRQQAEQMRTERFSRAEKAGARASQLMLLPMMIFIMPAVFIMVFGPVILQFMGQK